MAKVELTFMVDANGILKVSAREQTSGREATVQVTPSHGLTDEEVERMIVDSIEKAEEDFSARKLVEARTEATRVIVVTRKSLAENAALISPEQVEKLRKAVDELDEAVKGNDADRVMALMDDVNNLGMPLAEAMMNQVANKVLKDRKVADL
jgi:molecular chaperone DnaK (HSP70)